MATMRLSQNKVDNIPTPDDGREEYRDTVTIGLTLRVSPESKTYYIRYRTKAGRRRAVKLGAASVLSLSRARALATEILTEVALGGDPAIAPPESNEDLRLGEYLEDTYFPAMREEVKSAADFERKIRCFASLWGKRISEITPQDIDKIRTEWRKANTAATVNKKVAALKAALNWGIKKGFLSAAPLRIQRLPETDSTPKLRYLSQEEEERLMEELRHGPDYLRVMVVVSLKTGIRRGALFRLEWSDIDFIHKTLHIRGEICKTGKGRIIPLSESTLQVLREWGPGEGLVFVSPKTGGRFDNVGTAWERVLREAGIENFRWHDLRHTFASRLVMAGVDLNVVRELMGHSDLKMTLRYAHLAPEAKSRAVELLG